MQRELAFVPGLVLLAGDIREAQLRDIELVRIMAALAQCLAINLSLLLADTCEMIAVASRPFGSLARASTDPDGRMGTLDRLGIQSHVAHGVALSLEGYMVLG